MDPARERDPFKNPLAWVDPGAFDQLVRMAGRPTAVRYEIDPDHPSGLPATRVVLDWAFLAQLRGTPLGEALQRAQRRPGAGQVLAVTEAHAALLAGGVKLFCPTEEQFEAMEHVEISIPMSQYRQPFPAMAVRIPAACRARLAAEFGLSGSDDVPWWVVVRHRRGLDTQDTVVASLTCPRGGLGDVFYLFSDCQQNPTVEAALARDVGSDGSIPVEVSGCLHRFGHRATRAAMNLLIMLTRVPTRLDGPPEPRNARERRERQFGGRHSYRVVPEQEIVVRAGGYRPPRAGDAAPTGREMPPHWRKGHWRAHPGYGEARARGEQVPLSFIAPCLVRDDRLAGPDAPGGGVTYRG